jgi:hypothetical protein
MPHYESDVTKFLREMHEKRPTLDEEQRIGRAIYWDKQLDADELARWKASGVPQQAYVYFQPKTK